MHISPNKPIYQDVLPSQKESGTLLYLGNVPFFSPWQRPQHLALRLAKHFNLVYLDPNRSFLQLLRKPLENPPPLPTEVHCVEAPYGLPMARTFASIHRWNYWQVLRRLKIYLAKNKLNPVETIIATFPDQWELTEKFPKVPLIYDLMDEPTLFVRRHERRRYERLHNRMLGRAEMLITSSRVLQERYGFLAKQSRCITNGVREGFFADLEKANPHSELAKLPGPRFGYIGMISHWFDFPAVTALAKAFPQGSVILVGPAEVSIPSLPSNVIVFGSVPHLELAPVLKAFDVGLIPFRRSAGIDAVNPVKLYEYLAAGLPVLSSWFSELRAYLGLISVYQDARSCIWAAEKILEAGSTKEEKETRRIFARKHCWSVKVEKFLQALRQIKSSRSVAA